MPNKKSQSELIVEILSITVLSEITASIGGNPINPPNWEKGCQLNDFPSGSLRPGIFKINTPQPSRLALEVKVTGLANEETMSLTGKIKNMVFHRIISGKNIEQIIEIEIKVMPTDFTKICGDIEWSISKNCINTNECYTTNVIPSKTFLELYWIYDDPGQMYKLKCVWIEVLRLVAQIAPGLDTKIALIRRIINYCHAGTGIIYNSYDGSSYYGTSSSGGSFQLGKFLKKIDEMCNCYDQAAALQSILGALGIPLTWLKMKPFGYINTTHLIGRGLVNNPVYLYENNPDKSNPELIDINDIRRRDFGIHTFCSMEINSSIVVLDSCIGPYLGDASLNVYLDACVDRLTDLYSSNHRFGTTTDVVCCAGITELDRIFNLKDKESEWYKKFMADTRTIKFIENTNFENIRKNTPHESWVVFNWLSINDCKKIKSGGWKKHYQEIRNNNDAVEMELHMIRGSERLRIEVFVSSVDIEAAWEHLLIRALSTTSRDNPFKKSPKETSLGHLSVDAHFPNRNKTIWIFYNVCVTVESFDSSFDLFPLKKWIQQKMESNTKKDLSKYLPTIKENKQPSDQKIKIDQEISIPVKVKINSIRAAINYLFNSKYLKLDFFQEGESIRLEEKKKHEIKFISKNEGSTFISVWQVDTKHLLCSKPITVEVDVKPDMS